MLSRLSRRKTRKLNPLTLPFRVSFGLSLAPEVAFDDSKRGVSILGKTDHRVARLPDELI